MDELKQAQFVWNFVLPNLVVEADLDDLFIRDEDAAIKAVMDYLESDAVDIEVLWTSSFDEERDDLLRLLDSLSENDQRVFATMFLIEAVASFEGAVNCWLSLELDKKYGIDTARANTFITNLKGSDKYDTFLQILTGKRFADLRCWSTIKPLLGVRNSLTHRKPSPDFPEKIQKVTPQVVRKFLDASAAFVDELRSSSSEAVREYNRRVDNIAAINAERQKARETVRGIQSSLRKFEELLEEHFKEAAMVAEDEP